MDRYTRQLPKVIVGTKADLASSRDVDAAAAEAMATENGAAYIECSAKNNTNVEAVFAQLAQVLADKFLSEKTKVVEGDDGIVLPSSALLVMEKKGRCVVS